MVIYWTGVHSALFFFPSVMMVILSCCSDLNMHFVYLFLSFFLSGSCLDKLYTRPGIAENWPSGAYGAMVVRQESSRI